MSTSSPIKVARKRPLLTTAALTGIIILGCASNDDTAQDISDEDHDCVPYSPTPDLGDLSGSWSDSDAEGLHSFTVPDASTDPGGGVVTIEIESAQEPWLTVTLDDPAATGNVFSTSAAAQSNNKRIDARFEVGPGETYEVVASQYGGSPAEDYPIEYTLHWFYASKVDCYEPNNDETAARQIPVNQDISAYILGGYRSATQVMEDHTDWYSFTLTEDAEVSVDFTSTAPSNVTLSIDVFGASISGSLRQGELWEGSITAATPQLLAAGDYTLRVEPFYHPEDTVLFEDEDSAHWSEQYTFMVTATPK